MRISDWSSDVCSSDLRLCLAATSQLSPIIYRMSCSRYVSLIIVPALPSIKVDAILDEWCATGRPKLSHFGYNGAICVPSYCQLMTKLRSEEDRKSTRLNSSHYCASRMPSSA